MTDDRDTGEHFLGALPEHPHGEVQVSARRIADLARQIDFLDIEVDRHRSLLESERLRHATELAAAQRKAEARLDAELRTAQMQTKMVHHSYRSLLAKRKIEFEQFISDAAARHQEALVDERRRYGEMVRGLRARHDIELESSRRQAVDEIETSAREVEQRLTRELAQATAMVQHLEREIDRFSTRADHAEALAHQRQLEVDSLRAQLDAATSEHRKTLEEIGRQLDVATRRLEAERRRSAATLAELLERSASIASEADRARSEAAAAKAKSEHVAEATRDRAQADYAKLAQTALERETELEALVADLRAELMRTRRSS